MGQRRNQDFITYSIRVQHLWATFLMSIRDCRSSVLPSQRLTHNFDVYPSAKHTWRASPILNFIHPPKTPSTQHDVACVDLDFRVPRLLVDHVETCRKTKSLLALSSGVWAGLFKRVQLVDLVLTDRPSLSARSTFQLCWLERNVGSEQTRLSTTLAVGPLE
jgi:hypothetical protein